jgi:hypothetical protein
MFPDHNLVLFLIANQGRIGQTPFKLRQAVSDIMKSIQHIISLEQIGPKNEPNGMGPKRNVHSNEAHCCGRHIRLPSCVDGIGKSNYALSFDP